ncbi:monofunctional biosynthetic peptidoglycan transglycosylase [Sulfuricurvum sp.]|uniref:monofunctional biosynthetic peptidoglycan transglycosylase n=1 Tax=Sulfuricurvum sp. TaxID=2025608 RepID=UPI002D56A618|nr:monofunctional biosynthetic peptidoglycan transglycosylase [Sulfuricurvum sp.]HZF69358.1 monofunctional biosynthetic peptidoglycan transglycosylase [Sulfuricurvum sp.]
MSKLKLFFIILLIGGFIDIGRYLIYPNVSDLRDIHPIPTAFMEYREDQWASENRDMHITQKWVPISQISPNIIKAVLIGEDDKFWNHDGFDVNGMEQALERSLKKGSVAGGSTISQQLAKNLYLSPSKNPIRKIKEAILTWRIESTLSKRQILELYLNVAEWGDGIFGIEAAARHYYHKSAKNLTGLEAAHLAAVLPNPIRYNATGNQKYVVNRSRIIYKIMKRRGIVIPQYQEVMTPPKKEEVIPTTEESNQSVTDLFNESNPSEPATENAGEADIPASNDTNTSMKF